VLIVSLLAISFFILLACLLAFWINYEMYTSYLRKAHAKIWEELYSRDPFLPKAGPELRWLGEPAAPLASIFKIRETYGDSKIAQYKKRAQLLSYGLLGSLILLVAVIPLLIAK